MTETKVLYIAGMPHSGSTIVSQVLGEIDGFVSTGELYYLWDALQRGWPCGCGRPLRECEWWTSVLEALGEADGPGRRALRPDRYYMSLRGLPAVTLRNGVPLASYRQAIGAVLRSIRDHAGARVVVDSSKSPTIERILGGIRDVDLRVVHLVRSPQAVASSWSRFPGEAGRPARHAALWLAWNALVEAASRGQGARYLRIRYEDFAEKPRETVEVIVRFAGEEVAALPFVSDREVRLRPAHTVAGNDVRFRIGDVAIRLDEAWKEGYPLRDRHVVEALTWPLRARYGYA